MEKGGTERKKDVNPEMRISCVLNGTGKVTGQQIVGGPEEGLIVVIGVLKLEEIHKRRFQLWTKRETQQL